MDVARQLKEQLVGVMPDQERAPMRNNLPPDEPAQILR